MLPEVGAEICGKPKWLASALRKIESLAQCIDNNSAERNPSTAHMFIINPLHARRHDKLFSTHPSTDNRIAALKRLVITPKQATQTSRISRVRKRIGPWG